MEQKTEKKQTVVSQIFHLIENNFNCSTIEEEINQMDILTIKQIFDDADGGQLNEEDFVKHFGGLLGKNRDRDEIKTLFAMIDSNANEAIDWEEFSSHLLMESEGMRRMIEDSDVRFVKTFTD